MTSYNNDINNNNNKCNKYVDYSTSDESDDENYVSNWSKYIDLDDNEFGINHISELMDITNVKEIHYKFQKLKSLPIGIFDNKINLTVLDLSYNELTIARA